MVLLPYSFTAHDQSSIENAAMGPDCVVPSDALPPSAAPDDSCPAVGGGSGAAVGEALGNGEIGVPVPNAEPPMEALS